VLVRRATVIAVTVGAALIGIVAYSTSSNTISVAGSGHTSQDHHSSAFARPSITSSVRQRSAKPGRVRHATTSSEVKGPLAASAKPAPFTSRPKSSHLRLADSKGQSGPPLAKVSRSPKTASLPGVSHTSLPTITTTTTTSPGIGKTSLPEASTLQATTKVRPPIAAVPVSFTRTGVLSAPFTSSALTFATSPGNVSIDLTWEGAAQLDVELSCAGSSIRRRARSAVFLSLDARAGTCELTLAKATPTSVGQSYAVFVTRERTG